LRQITLQSDAGKVITPIATGSAVMAGVGVVGIAATGVVSVPVIVVVGAVAVTGAVVFTATQWVGEIFSADSPPEWASFVILRTWSPKTANDVLSHDLGCTEFVETEND